MRKSHCCTLILSLLLLIVSIIALIINIPKFHKYTSDNYHPNHIAYYANSVEITDIEVSNGAGIKNIKIDFANISTQTQTINVVICLAGHGGTDLIYREIVIPKHDDSEGQLLVKNNKSVFTYNNQFVGLYGDYYSVQLFYANDLFVKEINGEKVIVIPEGEDSETFISHNTYAISNTQSLLTSISENWKKSFNIIIIFLWIVLGFSIILVGFVIIVLICRHKK